jgi:hypothetical protein
MSVGSTGWYTANVFSDESTIGAKTTTISIPWPHSKFVITNDSTSIDLTLKMQPSNASSLSLKSQESITILHRTKEVEITSPASADYRLWAFG